MNENINYHQWMVIGRKVQQTINRIVRSEKQLWMNKEQKWMKQEKIKYKRRWKRKKTQNMLLKPTNKHSLWKIIFTLEENCVFSTSVCN
jgi:hypothetical protein